MIIAFLWAVSKAFVWAVSTIVALPVPFEELRVSQDESTVAVHATDAVIEKVSLLFVRASIVKEFLFTDKVGVGVGGGEGFERGSDFLLQE